LQIIVLLASALGQVQIWWLDLHDSPSTTHRNTSWHVTTQECKLTQEYTGIQADTGMQADTWIHRNARWHRNAQECKLCAQSVALAACWYILAWVICQQHFNLRQQSQTPACKKPTQEELAKFSKKWREWRIRPYINKLNNK
jgi:hypothetical protein